MAVFHVMLKIYEEFSWNFNWYVGPGNLAKEHGIFSFFNLDLWFHFTVHLHPIVRLQAKNRAYFFWEISFLNLAQQTIKLTFNSSQQRLRNPFKKRKFLAISCSLVVKWRNLIGSLALGIEKPYPFTTLNVMGGFFLTLTMDIFHGKFILGKSSHTHHAN